MTALRSIECRDAGFTILEVLVALVIVAVSTASIGALMAGNARAVRAMEQHVAQQQVARQVMAVALSARAGLGQGKLVGETAGFQWQIDIGPPGKGWTVDSSASPWIPALVRVRILSAAGVASDIRTVRLLARPSE